MPSEETALWGVLGLGNPLPEYATTRHNVGQRVVDEIAHRTHSRMRRRGKILVATSTLFGAEFILARSLTYMNESGLAAKTLVKQMGIPPSQLLVVCDDINIPLGRLRLRRCGSDGGHNGLRSIIQALETREFPRLRVGVGVVPSGEDAVEYVLGTFAEEEESAVGRAVIRAADCIETAVVEGIGAAMNHFNRKIHPDQG